MTTFLELNFKAFLTSERGYTHREGQAPALRWPGVHDIRTWNYRLAAKQTIVSADVYGFRPTRQTNEQIGQPVLTGKPPRTESFWVKWNIGEQHKV